MKMEEWKECKLGEYLYIKGRIGWKGLKKDEYLKESPYRIINGESLTEKGIEWSKAGFITKERYDESPEIMLEINDILLSKDGTIGKIGFVKELLSPTTVASGIFVIRNIKPEIIDTMFIYHFLRSSKFKNFIKMRTEGSVIPHLYQKDFEELDFPLPPLPTQQKIADILSSLDDKIELNNKINTNLEQQAQALFKNWFVDFEPFGGKMPEGWEEGIISDLGKVICGKTPSTKIKEYYGLDIPFITIPDMHNSVYACYTERYLSTQGAKSQEGKNLPPNSICVSCIATPGLVVLTDRISQTNQQINSIIPNNNVSPYYVYLTIQNLSETITMLGSSGSTTSNLNKEQFSKIKIIIPNDKTMKEFDSCVQPMFEKIRTLLKENYELVTIRDTLLPKLMNGEIDV